ncbi:uncharacterized protein AMSG_02669 [Thecamonas trahens ATCC 50062]|uniref:Uncharacterized protein n=1 Tax=Thecamonas trahens ATCC 50062 TaxID=461836 RepID=A0A0L0D4J0_THETB|nr:hypothetical protein AMSG_02669 [Thecamonas trahens ATCC 50062]KNC46218.1 hypothetical protein AMSG_02669 [Thecamonas trahens ATCC 50062]|eukprot:XP_013760515.1 hypothetical protein AMSG_02669 [Thecamonas trahens ATCC 50062]
MSRFQKYAQHHGYNRSPGGPYARATHAGASPVPEDRQWASELAAYERSRSALGFRLPSETPHRVTHAEVKAVEAAFNPLTGRYTDPDHELAVRSREQAVRSQKVRTSGALAKQRDRTPYNILSNIDHGAAVASPTARLSRADPYGHGGQSPPPAALPPQHAAGRRSISDRSTARVSPPRVTANHSNYTYDIIGGQPLASDAERVSPLVRSGARQPPPQYGSGRSAPASHRHPPPPRAPSRSYNILTCEEERSAPRRAGPSRSHDGNIVLPAKGKAPFHTSQSIVDYNIITGRSSSSLGTRGGKYRLPYTP